MSPSIPHIVMRFVIGGNLGRNFGNSGPRLLSALHLSKSPILLLGCQSWGSEGAQQNSRRWGFT